MWSDELARRLGATLLLVCLARLGYFIPIPGVCVHVGTCATTAVERLFGSSAVVANVFVMGITPLMSAHFGLAAANVFPAVRKHFFTLREQGPQGRDVYQAYASGLFLFFALWEVS